MGLGSRTTVLKSVVIEGQRGSWSETFEAESALVPKQLIFYEKEGLKSLDQQEVSESENKNTKVIPSGSVPEPCPISFIALRTRFYSFAS